MPTTKLPNLLLWKFCQAFVNLSFSQNTSKPIATVLIYLFQANCCICSTSLQNVSSSFKNLISLFFDLWIFFCCCHFIWWRAVVSCRTLVIRGVCGLPRKRCVPKLRSSLFHANKQVLTKWTIQMCKSSRILQSKLFWNYRIKSAKQ